MKQYNITYDELFAYMEWNKSAYNESQYCSNKDVYVDTPSGKTKILGGVVKEKLDMINVQFSGGSDCDVAKTHIFSDNGEEVFAQDAEYVDTQTGSQKVEATTPIGEHDGYDINIAAPHWYYNPNGIIYHNTLFLCHLSAAWLAMTKNVLYITLEMAEERIAERIDANLMDVEVNRVKNMDKSVFDANINRMKSTMGKLVIKEYPTGSANVGHFRFLMQELKQKQGFVPDVVCIDYINICSSARVKNTSANSYTIVKSITEELRGFAVEFNLPVFSLTQTGRSGFDASDISATDVSESIGLVQTADMLLGLVSNDDLKGMGHLVIKAVKNSRYGEDGTYHTVGIDRAKMKLFDLEEDVKFGAPPAMGAPGMIGTPGGGIGLPPTDKFAGFKL